MKKTYKHPITQIVDIEPSCVLATSDPVLEFEDEDIKIENGGKADEDLEADVRSDNFWGDPLWW